MATFRDNPFSYWMCGASLEVWTEQVGLRLTDDKPSYAWVDIETTGLCRTVDPILNLGILLTNEVGDVCREGAIDWLVFPQQSERKKLDAVNALEDMTPLVREMHEKNGLLKDLAFARGNLRADCLDTSRVSADAFLWLHQQVGPSGVEAKVQFSGSSAHFDRGFIEHQMPALNAWFDYRIGVDVSGLREVARRVQPMVLDTQPEKLEKHRPLPDLADSVRLYRHLLKNFLICDLAANNKLNGFSA